MSASQFPDKFAWVRALNDPNSGLTSTQHHVALALSEHLSREGKGFVTHATLALETRMSERTVCSALTALAEQHWIERIPGKVGWATTYTIAKKFGWTPTPVDQLPKRPRRKRRQMLDSNEYESAKNLLRQIFSATGIDPAQADLDDHATSRLLGALRRQLNSVASDRSELAKLWQALTETSLSGVGNPAAVLLTRYKSFLKTYDHSRPKRKSQALRDLS